MKYLPLADLDIVTNSLNFSTLDCHVIGGCDIYTTKAAGRDKKLYKDIEHSLESQYESLVRLSASLSPPYLVAGGSDDGQRNGEKQERQERPDKPGSHKKRSHTVEIPDIDLSRDSPFGPLSQITARRTFAYLIATLNASHPDYDFSHMLRPSDFRKERSLRRIMQSIDSTLQNLRPQPKTAYLAPPTLTNLAPCVANSAGNPVWSPRMWNLIDEEMSLRDCDRYSYAPEDDPFDGGEGSEGPAIWSMHYFFFNRVRKRVGYLYLRGLSVISHSPVNAPTLHSRLSASGRSPGSESSRTSVSVGQGAGKRASYWLGDMVADEDAESMSSHADDDYEDDDRAMADSNEPFDPENDEVDVPRLSLDDIRSDLVEGYYSYDAEEHGFMEDAENEAWSHIGLPLGTKADPVDADVADVVEGTEAWPVVVRGISEEVGDAMEL